MANSAADIGCIGLSQALSQNLILNLDYHGYVVAVYDEYTNIVAALADHEAKYTKIICTYSLEEMVNSLKENPRIVMLREPDAAIRPTLVDDLIEKLEPLLSPGDIIVDYSNSASDDTSRRVEDLKSRGILFVGCGINEDEEEARRGPLLMLGGNSEAWPFIKPIFQTICSKINGEPSCDWLGEGGVGHDIMSSYRKQLSEERGFMLEAYYLMHYRLGMDNKEISCIFSDWNTGYMKSTIFDKIINILKNYTDEDDSLEIYKLKSGEVGSGMWTAIMSHHHANKGSIFYTCLCGLLKLPNYIRVYSRFNYEGNKEEILEYLRNALCALTVHIYCQNVESMLFRFRYGIIEINIPFKCIVRIWKGSCNTRCDIVNRLEANVAKIADFTNYNKFNISSDDFFIKAIKDNLPAVLEIFAVCHDLDINLLHFKFLMTGCVNRYSGKQ